MRRRDAEAMALYEAAIEAAAGCECPRERALANEFCARFWLNRGNEAVATVMKAVQAIAKKIVLEEVLRKLMRIAIENAGAERGLFLKEREGRMVIGAEAVVDRDEIAVRESVPPASSAQLSRTVVQYAWKTGESVVIGDALTDERCSADPYVASARPRSILCVPVVYQGRRVGMLYLENNLAADAFADERVEVMRVLSAQAPISLENARLYDEMRQEVAGRRRAEEDLRAALAEVEQLKNQLQAENLYLQEETRREHAFEEMVGSSPAPLEVLRKVGQVAPTDTTVLVLGETGTGKELIARAIHNRSLRRDRPLVKVNCGAISAGLVESELFGHVKGAFTGALECRVGRLELADGGTLFLDEVSELPPETQVKLLRVLQEQEFEPVGSSRTVRVDVRIIAASNRNLDEAVRAGRFRADLFYRLNVFPRRVPPLRERRSDIPKLVMLLLARFSKKFGKRIETVSQDTMDLLMRYEWPGNVRELRNIVERAMVLARGPVLVLDHDLLPAVAPVSRPEAVRGTGGIEARAAPEGAVGREPGDLASSALRSLEETERRHILAALKRTGGWSRGRTAQPASFASIPTPCAAE